MVNTKNKDSLTKKADMYALLSFEIAIVDLVVLMFIASSTFPYAIIPLVVTGLVLGIKGYKSEEYHNLGFYGLLVNVLIIVLFCLSTILFFVYSSKSAINA